VLTPGNRKLGQGRLVWGFGLPALATCPGRSATCAAHCYALRLERFRPSVARRYRANLALSRRADFADRVDRFVDRRGVRLGRVHTSGDFYSAAYARKWLAVFRRRPGTRFYYYTRSWRVPAVRPVLAAMARLPNVRAWYSCDRDTGAPARVRRGVRLAWLMAEPGDLPPRADLVFRIRRLRGAVQKRVDCRDGPPALVCPVENGATGHRTDCGRCGLCWRGPPTMGPGRIPLPLADQS